MKKKSSKLELKFFKFSFKNILFFLYVWFCLGFSCGTGILMGPVRWLTNMSRENQWSSSTENLLVMFNIIILVIGTFLLSLFIVKALIKTKKKVAKYGISILIGFIAVFIMWLWMNPKIMAQGEEEVLTVEQGNKSEFHFGNYPMEEDLIRLKEQEFTAVISLLHKAVVPFEPKLLADEEELAKKVGIELIHIPMLPWISENKESIEKIKDLAINGEGKYFVHCYLGKDRVNVTKRLIRAARKEAAIIDEGTASRSLDDIDSFERGKIFRMARDVYFTPYPTDEEYFGYIISGSFKQVVSLLNPDNPKDNKLIIKENNFLVDYEIPFEILPITVDPYDPIATLEIINTIKKMQKPIVIHAFFTKGSIGEVFIETYKSGLPTLPPSLFKVQMKNGIVSLLASNIAAGNEPLPNELESYLFNKGIRKIGFTGNPYSSVSRRLKPLALDVGLKWEAIDLGNPEAIAKLKIGGPWYVFGSNIDDIKKAIE